MRDPGGLRAGDLAAWRSVVSAGRRWTAAPVQHLRWSNWTTRSEASRWYLVPMLLLIGVVAGLLAYEYTQAPLPPGVDPGHWLSVSYGFVGLPTAPDPANRPLFYSPLMFPFLGALVLVTANPPLAASVLAVALFIGYGLSVAHLARRYLRKGAMQVGLVGMAMACGTTLQMLFWGAYPNYLGFILMNESLVFLLLFVRERRTRDAALFYTFAALTYLAHDLTFFVLAAVIAASAILLLIFRRISIRFLVDRRNIAGMVGLGAVVEGFGLITARLGISHPSYFYANPSAYFVDEIGEIFAPLSHAPAFSPPGAVVQLAPSAAVILLLAVPFLLLLGLVLAQWRWPRRLTTRFLIGSGWMAAAAAVPALGYAIHIDTDYSRFLYYLPLPFAVLAFLAAEQVIFPTSAAVEAVAAVPSGAGVPLPRGPPPNAGLERRYREREVGAGLVVGVAILVVFATVTFPVAQKAEITGTAAGHDATFVQAADWLGKSPLPGNVLTDSSVARWTEALSNRETFTVGPVWLLFDPFQITYAQESYWALNSQYAVTNGQTVLSYSGFNTTAFNQAPLYTFYDQGIPFPVFRVLPGSLELNATINGVTGWYPVAGAGTPALNVFNDTSARAVIVYTGPAGSVSEVGASTTGGSARITFGITPGAGVTVHSIAVALAGPPAGAPGLTRDESPGPVFQNGALEWTVWGPLGQYPSPAAETTTVDFVPGPLQQGSGSFAGVGAAWKGVFPNPTPTGGFTVNFSISTPNTSNPDRSLPPAFSTGAFLANHQIHFLLWHNGSYYASQSAYYTATFGFHPVWSNAGWVILRG